MSRLCLRAAAVSCVDRWSTTLQPLSRRSRLISSIISNSSASSGLVVGAGVLVRVAVGLGVAAVVGDDVLVEITVGEVVGRAVTTAVLVVVGRIADVEVGASVATSADIGAGAVAAD